MRIRELVDMESRNLGFVNLKIHFLRKILVRIADYDLGCLLHLVEFVNKNLVLRFLRCKLKDDMNT